MPQLHAPTATPEAPALHDRPERPPTNTTTRNHISREIPPRRAGIAAGTVMGGSLHG